MSTAYPDVLGCSWYCPDRLCGASVAATRCGELLACPLSGDSQSDIAARQNCPLNILVRQGLLMLDGNSSDTCLDRASPGEHRLRGDNCP